jgi:transposase
MIQASLDHIGSLEKIIAGLDQEINRKLKDYQKEYELLQTIPGVKEQGAASIIAEIGKEFHNRVFDSIDSLEDHLEKALHDMEHDHDRIRSIVAWPWIMNALMN